MFRFRSPGQPGESLVPIFLSMKIPEYAYAQGLKEVLGVGPCAAKRPSVSVVSIAIDGAEIGAHARPAKRRPPQSDLAGYAAACMTTPLNPQGHAVPTTDRWPLTAASGDGSATHPHAAEWEATSKGGTGDPLFRWWESAVGAVSRDEPEPPSRAEPQAGHVDHGGDVA